MTDPIEVQRPNAVTDAEIDAWRSSLLAEAAKLRESPSYYMLDDVKRTIEDGVALFRRARAVQPPDAARIAVWKKDANSVPFNGDTVLRVVGQDCINEAVELMQRAAPAPSGLVAAAQVALRALANAGVVMDAVPTRLHEHPEAAVARIGVFVNEQGVYQQVRDAEKTLRDALGNEPSANEPAATPAPFGGVHEFLGSVEKVDALRKARIAIIPTEPAPATPSAAQGVTDEMHYTARCIELAQRDYNESLSDSSEERDCEGRVWVASAKLARLVLAAPSAPESPQAAPDPDREELASRFENYEQCGSPRDVGMWGIVRLLAKIELKRGAS